MSLSRSEQFQVKLCRNGAATHLLQPNDGVALTVLFKRSDPRSLNAHPGIIHGVLCMADGAEGAGANWVA